MTQSEDATASPGSPDANIATVRRFFDEVVNQGRLDVVDEIFAPDYLNHNTHPGQTPGPEGVKTLVTNVRAAFPDIEETVEDIFGAGDRVALRLTMRGTHTGREFRGVLPTGKEVNVTGMAIVRVVDGKIPDGWFFFDRLALYTQLGAITPPQ